MPKPALVRGAVKPWHVLFLFSASWLFSGVGAYKLAEHIAVDYRMAIRDVAVSAIGAVIILTFTIVVPEFRRSLAVLFARPRSRPKSADLAIAFALTLCWGYGIYRLTCFLFLQFHPEAYRTLGFGEALAPFQAQFLVFWVGAVLVAPFAEELIFRGFLLNLWAARWGAWPAVIISSITFGLFHWTQAIFAAPLGLVLALVYLRYDSLWPGILIHAAYNLLAVPWLLGRFFAIKPQAAIGLITHWIPEIAVALLFIPFLLAFWRRFKPAAT